MDGWLCLTARAPIDKDLYPHSVSALPVLEPPQLSYTIAGKACLLARFVCCVCGEQGLVAVCLGNQWYASVTGRGYEGLIQCTYVMRFVVEASALDDLTPSAQPRI